MVNDKLQQVYRLTQVTDVFHSYSLIIITVSYWDCEDGEPVPLADFNDRKKQEIRRLSRLQVSVSFAQCCQIRVKLTATTQQEMLNKISMKLQPDSVEQSYFK